MNIYIYMCMCHAEKSSIINPFICIYIPSVSHGKESENMR